MKRRFHAGVDFAIHRSIESGVFLPREVKPPWGLVAVQKRKGSMKGEIHG